MKRSVSYLLVLGLLIPVVLSTQFVYGQMGYVNGIVTDQAGKPIKDVEIRIESMGSGRKYTVKTNKNGEYLHAGVYQQDLYRVIAEKNGYISQYVENVKPGYARDQKGSTVNFTLKAGENVGKLEFEMTDEEREALKKRQEEARKQVERLEAVRGTFEQAVGFYNAGQFQEAANGFEEVLKVDQEQPSVWANLGNCYAKMDNNEKALEAFQKAVDLDPTNPTFLQNLGSIYATMGNAEKARELYAKAAESSSSLNPRDAAANYYNMGITYINQGDNENAAVALRKAIAADPNHAEAHYQLGLTLMGLGNMEEAVSMLKQYLDMAPSGENAEVAKQLIESLGG